MFGYLISLLYGKSTCKKCNGSGKRDVSITRIGNKPEVQVVDCHCVKSNRK